MNVYIVVKNYQDYDSDNWCHWVSEKHIAYHQTEEGANEAIKKLLEQDFKNHMDNHKRNTHVSYAEWVLRGKPFTDNLESFRVSVSEATEEKPLYFVRTELMGI